MSYPDYSNFTAIINARKASKVQEMPIKIAKSVGVACEVSEKDNGFLKDKNITVKATGEKIKLDAFFKLFSHYLVLPKSKEKNITFTELLVARKMRM